MQEYNGDIISIERLSKFYTEFSWNDGEIVELNDIYNAINNGQLEEEQAFGDHYEHLCLENKSTKWHIGRVIYFINHPEEINNIEIDNLCDGIYIFPIPIIIDGNHRFLAAKWLHSQNKMETVCCRYSGRQDLLDYLTNKTDICPDE